MSEELYKQCQGCAAKTRWNHLCYYCAAGAKQCMECGADLKTADEITWLLCLAENAPGRSLVTDEDDEIGSTINQRSFM